MKNILWVVYQTIGDGKLEGRNAVCEQGEWEALQLAQPGKLKLIKARIKNEGEAERLARGTSGDPMTRLPARG
jgi:hypothetical protein